MAKKKITKKTKAPRSSTPDGNSPSVSNGCNETATVTVEDILRVETPGGGGWGPPAERTPEEVLRDVLRGFVSPGSAREVFLVALRGGPAWEVDEEETRRLRGGGG